MTGAVSGVRPRILDRVWFGVKLLPTVLNAVMRLLVLAALLTFGFGWLVKANPVLIAIPIAVGIAIAGWYLSVEWRWERQPWRMFLRPPPFI